MPVDTTNSNELRPLETRLPDKTIIDGSVSPSIEELGRRYYPDYRPNILKELVEREIRAADQVLEIGAGSGKGNQAHFDLRGRVARYTGIDPDPSVLGNQYLDEAYVGRAESLPFADNSFDLVFHCFVAEHFEDPLKCNREIARVLKPTGRLIFLTPSRYFYASLGAQMTPHWFHELYISRFASGRASNEVFPTYYRLNTEKAITKQLCACGFECEMQHVSIPPGYLRFNKYAFLLGVLFERTFERSCPALRARLIVDARKKG